MHAGSQGDAEVELSPEQAINPQSTAQPIPIDAACLTVPPAMSASQKNSCEIDR